MNIKEILGYWKIALGLVIVGGTTTISILAWAEDQKTLIRAEQQLIHNEQYQISRIARKRNQIQDNLKMIRLLQTDDTLSLQEEKFVNSLEEENIRLLQEIEGIETLIHTDE